MKVYHHNDHDGRCAAAIVEIYFSRKDEEPSLEARASAEIFKEMDADREYIEVDYKDEIDVEAIKLNELIYIVDFSFKPDVMEEVLKKTGFIVWIDHHKTAFEYQYSRNLDGIRNADDAACELTWKFLFPLAPIPRAVELIGDYDKWALQFKPVCFQFYEGLKLEDTSPTSAIWNWMFNSVELVEEITAKGKDLIIYRDNYCGDMRDTNGYTTKFSGCNCYALNVYGFGSQAFGNVCMNIYDACIAYIYDGKQYTVSLYSTRVDVSKIAQAFGGGGHKRAAGFTCRELPFKKTRTEKKGESCETRGCVIAR